MSNSDSVVVLALVVAAIVGVQLYKAPTNARLLIEVDCAPATRLRAEGRCVQSGKEGALLKVVMNLQTQHGYLSVLDDPDDTWGAPMFELSDCRVVDADNWHCGDQTSYGGPISSFYRMEKGQLSFGTTGGISPDYFHSTAGGVRALKEWLTLSALGSRPRRGPVPPLPIPSTSNNTN